MKDLTHVNDRNEPGMVDVSDKGTSIRTAEASGKVVLGEDIMARLHEGELKSKKGPVFQTAIIAGTQAVKKTWELIPFCHQILLESIKLDIVPFDSVSVLIRCRVKCTGKTGVEMEALTGVSTAALCIYDMCKALSHDIRIEEIKLLTKTGGKSDFKSSD